MLRPFRQSFKVVLVYGCIGLLWLFATHGILQQFFYDDKQVLSTITFWVRLSFVIASMIILYLLLERHKRNLANQAGDYSRLFDQNPNPMFVIDRKSFQFLAVNDATLMKYGYTRSELLKMTALEIRSLKDRLKLQKRLRSSRDNISSEGIWEHIKKNGEKFPVEVSTSPISWLGVDALLVVAYDVSVRMQYEQKLLEFNTMLDAEVQARTRELNHLTHELTATNEELTATNEELVSSNEELVTTNERLIQMQATIEAQSAALLRQSEEKLNTILGTLRDVVWSASLNNGQMELDYINSNATLDLYGYEDEDFLKDRGLLRRCVHEDDLADMLASYARLNETLYIQNEHRIRDRFGKVKWVSSRMWMTKNQDGIPVRYDGIITNIDEQKSAQLELVAEKEKLQRVFDNLPLMLVQLDTERNFVFVNKNCERITGWSVAEIMSPDIFEKTYPDEQIRNEVLSFIESGTSTWKDLTMTRQDGSTIETSWTNVVLPDGSLIGIGQDISERKEAEHEKNNLIEQLVEQNNDVLQFSFISSHNLRGPVATMIGLMNLIERDSIHDPHLLNVLEYLKHSIEKLDEVIRDLVKILEIRGLNEETKEQVSFDEILDTIQQNLISQIATSVIEIRVDTTAVKSIYAIRTYLQNIIYNLVTNAIKYRDPERKLIISFQTFVDPAYYGFIVQDNGLGFDAEKLRSKVFTLYQRFHPNIEGKGIGLYLVKTQVTLMKGLIDVDSSPGKGAKFTVRLPR